MCRSTVPQETVEELLCTRETHCVEAVSYQHVYGHLGTTTPNYVGVLV